MENTESIYKQKWNNIKFYCGYYYEYLKPYLRLSIEFSKIFLGCLLFIFVPQLCKGPDLNIEYLIDKYNLNITNDFEHVCTFQDNFYNATSYEKFVIFWNLLTLAIFLINFCWEIKRERYLKTHFEYSIIYPILDVNTIIEKKHNNLDNISEKKIPKSYKFKTQVLYWLNITCLIVMILNIIFSSIAIFGYHYNGFRSITGLFSSIILIFSKIYYNFNILDISLKEQYILSTTLIKPHDYNTLEPIKFKFNEYIKRENNSKSYKLFYLDKYDKYLLITSNHVSIFSVNHDSDKNINKSLRKDVQNKIIKDKLKPDDFDIELLSELLNQDKYEESPNKIDDDIIMARCVEQSDKNTNEHNIIERIHSITSVKSSSSINISKDDFKRTILEGDYDPEKILKIINKQKQNDPISKINRAIKQNVKKIPDHIQQNIDYKNNINNQLNNLNETYV